MKASINTLKLRLDLKWVAVLLFLTCSQNCFSQKYSFRHYNIGDGLAQSQVLKIYQDDNNYLWLGTKRGVSRFNGVDFVSYTKIDGFNGDMVFDILQKKDQILLRTEAGISSLKAGKIQNYSAPEINFLEKNLVKDNDGHVLFFNNYRLHKFESGKSELVSVSNSNSESVSSIAKGRDGRVYVSVYGNGIFCKKGNNWVKVISLTGIYKKLDIFKILADNSNNDKLYLLTPGQLFLAVNGTISKYKNVILDKHTDLLLSIEQDKQGNIWVGSNKGAYYLRKKDPIHFTSVNGFSDNAVNDIYRDNQDNIWLGTDGDGFYKFQGFNFISYDKIKTYPLNLVTAVTNDDFNNIWLATNGNGLIELSKGRLKHIKILSKDPYTRYVVSFSHKKGLPLLIGTYGGLWSLSGDNITQAGNGSGLPKDIDGVIYDDHNEIWVASRSGCYYLKKGNTVIKILDGFVSTLIQIGKDSVLAGTHKGLILIRNKIIDPDFRYHQLSGADVICLANYKNIVVGGTAGDGLFVIDVSKHVFKKYTTLNGFRSNNIYSLLLDKDGVFWAETGKGIARFKIDLKTQAISIINEVIPNPILEFAPNAALEYDDKIWLGTTSGLFVFSNRKDDDELFGNGKPAINIESVKIIDQADGNKNEYTNAPANNLPQGFVLRYGHEHMIISFKGIFYSEPENLLYQHRLQGFESQFSSPSRLSSMEYSALPPGKYTFQVRAVAKSGIKSDIKYINIQIKPAFFQTTYFFVLLLIIIVTMVVIIQYLFTYRKNKKREMLEEIKHEEQIRIRRQTAEDFHDDIGNKLTRIVILSDMLNRKSVKPDQEQQQLLISIKENANDLYKGAKDILWSLDPQNDCLSQVLDHIKYLAIDFFNNTKTQLIFDEFKVENDLALPTEFVRNISMIFKELLYNILKHADAKTVVLKAIGDAEKIKFVVFDNGRGFDENSEKKGRGLSNIRTRAKRINAIIEIESQPGEGTKVSLTIDRNALTKS